MAPDIVIFIIIYCFSLAGFCAFMANQKGRDATGWFVLGLVFNLIALIAISGLPVIKKKSQKEDVS